MICWRAVAAAALVSAVHPALAKEPHAIDIPAGTLGASANRLAAQSGASIAIAEPDLARLRTAPLSGHLSARIALRRLVRGLPVRVVTIDASTFRIIRIIARAPPARKPPRKLATPAKAPQPPPAEEILVTASKRGTAAVYLPGTAHVIGMTDLALGESAGTSTIARAVTSLSSTHLGSGRDKLFLRGVADSSFSGHTQATVGQYFGESRLNYAGPDPDLRLYDVERAELLLGPQGTLYGAGSLGGIIRITPHAPDPDARTAQTMLSASLTRHGAPGGEAAAMLNLPLGWREGALRLVGYRVREGGFVDDLARRKPNSNALDVTGARAALAFSPAESWRAEIAAIGQDIDGHDASYVDRRLGGLARVSVVAQPYASRFRLASLTLQGEPGDLDATANLAYSRIRLRDLFDASRALPGPLYLARRDGANVLTAEARVGSSDSGSGWLAGVSLVDSRARFASALHNRDGSRIESAARTMTREYMLFGEATRAFGPLAVTLGARAARWRSRSRTTARTGRPLLLAAADGGWRLLPAIALLWTAPGDLQLLTRYASSYRPPTAAASLGGVQTLSGDRYAAWEFAARVPPREGRPLSGGIALSLGRWGNVQADILDNSGYLSAANVGDARIRSLEATVRWRLSESLQIDGAATMNRTSLVPDGPGIINVTRGRLPNVPLVNGRIGLVYASAPATQLPLRLSAKLRYVGRSTLGVGPDLGRWQGGYAELDADASLRFKNAEWFVSGGNLLGSAGNRFALGSIAQAGLEELFIPQTPRTVRVGVRVDIR